MELNFEGILLAVGTFLIIGLCHPLVIKTEYYFGTRPWWVWLVSGIACCISALFVQSIFWSALLGVLGASLLWGIGELFSQEKRVLKGWFPMNPKRKEYYKKLGKNEHSCPTCKDKK
ncbi:MAG: DUF4491 family protein [Prevotella fusca]|uniref:DUF4491 family protein n=1 Tax=Prevotella fusca TaxID=589436 RepID=UPI003F9FC0D2